MFKGLLLLLLFPYLCCAQEVERFIGERFFTGPMNDVTTPLGLSGLVVQLIDEGPDFITNFLRFNSDGSTDIERFRYIVDTTTLTARIFNEAQTLVGEARLVGTPPNDWTEIIADLLLSDTMDEFVINSHEWITTDDRRLVQVVYSIDDREVVGTNSITYYPALEEQLELLFSP